MANPANRLLRELGASRDRAGPAAAGSKLALVEALARLSLPTAPALRAFHDELLWLLAYPDSARLAERAEEVLGSFERRPDLRRHADRLGDSGIAGTAIRYRFFWPMAGWLAARFPERLRVDWDALEDEAALRDALPLLVSPAEAEAVRKSKLPLRALLGRLVGPGETDACFLVRRMAALAGDDVTREAFHDRIDTPYVLAPGPGGPSRTHARLATPVALRSRPPERGRPDLRAEARRPPRAVRPLGGRAAAQAVDRAREAMVTRGRDLDAFSHGDPRDVRLVDDGDGLAFVLIGMRPERRLLVRAAYGALSVRNRVPIGYVQLDALGRESEVSFNTFPAFRGGEAARVFARVLALSHALFGSTSYRIEPYQLGHGNHEGIASGAWWFYYKLGFRPREPALEPVIARELERMARRPRHRTNEATLERLAAHHVYLDLDPERPHRWAPLERLGFLASRVLAERAGAEREAALEACEDEAVELMGLGRAGRRLAPGERLWLRRLSPLLLALPGVRRWSTGERRELGEVVRAKGGRRESDFALRFGRHPRLARALADLADSVVA